MNNPKKPAILPGHSTKQIVKKLKRRRKLSRSDSPRKSEHGKLIAWQKSQSPST